MKPKIYINETIYDLEYNSKQIFAFNNIVKKVEINSEEMKDNNYIVYPRSNQTVEKSNFDTLVNNVGLNITYTHTLLLANSKFIVGKSKPLTCKREPISFAYSFSSMSGNGTKLISEALHENGTNITSGIHNQYYDLYINKYQLFRNIFYNKDVVHDNKRFWVKFDCNIGFIQWRLGIEFISIVMNYLSVFHETIYTMIAEENITHHFVTTIAISLLTTCTIVGVVLLIKRIIDKIKKMKNHMNGLSRM